MKCILTKPYKHTEKGIYKAGSVKAFTESLHNNLKRTARDVLVAPLDDEDVIAAFVNDVTDVILITTNVLDSNLFTWQVRAKYTNHQHVVPCKINIMDTNYIKAGCTEQHPHIIAMLRNNSKIIAPTILLLHLQ